MGDDTNRGRRSGWRWSDDVLAYRVRFVSVIAVVAVAALIGYTLWRR